MAIDFDLAAGAFLQTGNGTHCRGLARAIRADEAADITGFHGKGKVVNGDDLGKIHAQMLDGQQRVGHAAIMISIFRKASPARIILVCNPLRQNRQRGQAVAGRSVIQCCLRSQQISDGLQ